MKIPPEKSTIAWNKLVHYLLVYKQKNDKSLFLRQAGFTAANPQQLETAIYQLLRENEAVLDLENEYGIFYRVAGDLQGPDGILQVITIWLWQENKDTYRFITLKPER